MSPLVKENPKQPTIKAVKENVGPYVRPQLPWEDADTETSDDDGGRHTRSRTRSSERRIERAHSKPRMPKRSESEGANERELRQMVDMSDDNISERYNKATKSTGDQNELSVRSVSADGKRSAQHSEKRSADSTQSQTKTRSILKKSPPPNMSTVKLDRQPIQQFSNSNTDTTLAQSSQLHVPSNRDQPTLPSVETLAPDHLGPGSPATIPHSPQQSGTPSPIRPLQLPLRTLRSNSGHGILHPSGPRPAKSLPELPSPSQFPSNTTTTTSQGLQEQQQQQQTRTKRATPANLASSTNPPRLTIPTSNPSKSSRQSLDRSFSSTAWTSSDPAVSRPEYPWGASKRWICCQCGAITRVESMVCARVSPVACAHVRCEGSNDGRCGMGNYAGSRTRVGEDGVVEGGGREREV